MKPIMQKEIRELVKKGDLKPHYLKPYREEEDKPIKSSEDKLIEAIYMLVAAMNASAITGGAGWDTDQVGFAKAILEAIKSQPVPEVKVENIIEKEEKKPERWEFKIIRDDNDKMSKVIAEAK